MLLVIDVEVRALIDMAWPLSWTNSQHALGVLERALRLSARQQDPPARKDASELFCPARASARHPSSNSITELLKPSSSAWLL
jgi:hypothetical protein